MISKIEKINQALFFLFIATLPLPTLAVYNSYILVCLTFFTMFKYNFDSSYVKPKINFLELLLLTAFFNVYLLSFIDTVDVKAYWREIETKFSLFFFPVFFAFYNPTVAETRQWFRWFVIVIVCVAVFSIPVSYFMHLAYGYDLKEVPWYFSQCLPHFLDIHRVYLAFQIFFVLVILIFDQHEYYFKKKELIFILPFLIFYLILLNPKTILFCFFLALIIYFIKYHHSYFRLLLFIALFVIGISFLYFNSKYLYQLLIVEFFGEVDPEKLRIENGISIRKVIYPIALDLIRFKPFWGYGVPNGQYALLKAYEKINFYTGVQYNLNVHNQFLQILVDRGFLGLFFFVLLIVMLLAKIKNFSFRVFLILSLVAGLTENIFFRQQSIVFFCFYMFSKYYEQKNTVI